MQTELDRAHAAMETAPDDDAARLRFYACFADSALHLLLASDAGDETVEPDVYEVDGQSYVLVFDSDERLAEFVGRAAPYATISGRGLVEMLAGQGVGLGLNLDVAPSAMLMPADAVDWLAATLANRPVETAARPSEISAPRGLPEALQTALESKLVRAGGAAQSVWLAAVRYDDGARGHLLAFVGAAEPARAALAAAAGEALTFSGIDAGAMDVTFVDADDPFAAKLARIGLRFHLPEPEAPPAPVPPKAPGMDPDKPPRLR